MMNMTPRAGQGQAYPSLEILIVEDSATQLQRLRYILEQRGYRVTAAVNGRLALAAARRSKPTLIISDVIMPEMDGYQLCREVKADPLLGDVPVILVTTLSDPHDVIRGLECRADNFVLKPYDENYLLGRVQFVLINRDMRQSDQPGMGLEIFFNGQKHFITADRLQILNLLLSTYDAAIQRNVELSDTQEELTRANSELQKLTAELEDRVRERTQQLERTNEKLKTQLIRRDLLNGITRAIGERQDLNSIFQVLILNLEAHLPVDFGCVYLYDAADNSLRLSSIGSKGRSVSLESPASQHWSIDAERNGLSRCQQGRLLYEPDIAQSQTPFFEHLRQGGLRSLVAAPLLVENKVFGILMTARQAPNAFNSDECEFVRQLSEHVALAAHQTQLYEALQQAYDDLRRTQQAIMQQERLRALGQMASGIAHDINNAISPVALYTESLLEREQNLSEQARKHLVTIQRAIDDVAQTVARMREFYRPRELEVQLTDVELNRVIEQVLDLTRARWSDQPQQRGVAIELKTELAEDLPDIRGAQNEIRDALTNLIFNAVDAMPEGGVLRLRTEECAEAELENATSRHVRLEVSDTGSGMDEETRRRCLEPFFTTKGERGTGLGLSMVYGMAQRHAADLTVDSEPGKGTSIRLLFPVHAPPFSSTVRLPALQVPARPLRILTVDDDPLLLESLSSVLESDGHQVTTAEGGQAGIDAFLAAQQRNEPFEVVITDLGMPYVDGRKVANSIRATAPQTYIILLTGWGQRVASDNDKPPQVDQLLGKPPRLHELRAALARCCESEPK